MATFEIRHQLLIKAAQKDVFKAVSEPSQLNEWWTETCEGSPAAGSAYSLGFGPPFFWKAEVLSCMPEETFELRMTEADQDWMDTVVGFHLSTSSKGTVLDFYHLGWKSPNDHFKISSFCWANYLKICKNYLERGIRVPYAERDL